MTADEQSKKYLRFTLFDSRQQFTEFSYHTIAFILEVQQIMHDGRLDRMGGQTFFGFCNGCLQLGETGEPGAAQRGKGGVLPGELLAQQGLLALQALQAPQQLLQWKNVLPRSRL